MDLDRTSSGLIHPESNTLLEHPVGGSNPTLGSLGTTSLLQATDTIPLLHQYTCSHCPLTFRYKANYKRHLSTHANIRPFSCPICHKTFTRKEDVTSHLRIHSGEKPYACPVCSRKFARISDMRSHSRTHAEKSYMCSECPKKYSRRYDLNVHLKNVHRIRVPKKNNRPVPSYSGQKENTVTSSLCPSHLWELTDSDLKFSDVMLPHSQHAQCGHLQVKHADHFDFVVNNQLVCKTGVSEIASGVAVENVTCDLRQHKPGCGHLPVRHKDHIDYVVEDMLRCCEKDGMGLGVGNLENVELMDEDFRQVYAALASLP